MRRAFNQNPHKWLFLTISGLFSVGIFLPYIEFQGSDFDKTDAVVKTVYYGWEWFSFQIHFAFATIILLISLSSRIALRLFVIRTLMILLILVIIVTFLFDNTFMITEEINLKQQIGFYNSYTGILLTILYSILHFRKSYPVYKRLLSEHQKQSSDILDEF